MLVISIWISYENSKNCYKDPVFTVYAPMFEICMLYYTNLPKSQSLLVLRREC